MIIKNLIIYLLLLLSTNNIKNLVMIMITNTIVIAIIYINILITIFKHPFMLKGVQVLSLLLCTTNLMKVSLPQLCHCCHHR